MSPFSDYLLLNWSESLQERGLEQISLGSLTPAEGLGFQDG